MASTYTSWSQFPPTGIEPKTSSFPKISLKLASYPPSAKPEAPKPADACEFLKCQYTISAVFETTKQGSKIKILS
jgi:hypothetical protein